VPGLRFEPELKYEIFEECKFCTFFLATLGMCFLLDFRVFFTAIESGAELAKQKSRNWAVLLVYYIPRSI